MSTLRQRWPPQGLGGGGGVDHGGRLLYPINDNPVLGNNTGTAARCYIRPIQVPVPITIDRLAILVVTALGNFRMGIYRDGGDTPAGGALVVETADTVMVANVNEVTIANTILTPGLYWIAVLLQLNTSNLVRGYVTGTPTSTAGGSLRASMYNRALGYGALTDPCPAVAADDRLYSMYARIASIP